MRTAAITALILVLSTAMIGGFARTAHAEEPVLHVYNWSDYIAPDTIPKFEAETGIKVTYDVYDGNEVLEAKLFAGEFGLRRRGAVGEPLHGAADRGRRI